MTCISPIRSWRSNWSRWRGSPDRRYRRWRRFPGFPLAIALPQCEVKLVESQGVSAPSSSAWRGIRVIGNAEVVCTRVEEWPEGIGVNDVVLPARWRPQPIVLEYAAPLLRLGGALVDWRGKRDPAEEPRLRWRGAAWSETRFDSAGRALRRRARPLSARLYVRFARRPTGFHAVWGWRARSLCGGRA